MSTTPASTIATEVGSLDTDLLTIAGTGIGIGVVVFAVRKGWRLVKGMI
jgi:hypothetical protein